MAAADQTSIIRKRMIDQIIELLEQRKHQPAMEERLRDMAMRLEKYLWEKSNGDMEEYSNTATLKQRLNVLAQLMARARNRDDTCSSVKTKV